MCWSLCEATRESVKITPVVHSEAMRKIEMWLNGWIHETKTDLKKKKKSEMCSIIIARIKAKEICGHIIQSQKMLTPRSSHCGAVS